MDSYTSMKMKTEPLGIYQITEGSAIDCELKAYAQGLDELFLTLSEMTRECFISTAETYGLSERERFSGRENTWDNTEERRKAILKAEQGIDMSASYQDFKKYIEYCGVSDYEIVESLSRERIDITINDTLDDVEKRKVEEKIKNGSPAYLSVIINFTS